MTKTTAKIPIGISSCLLGERVRYDGGHKNNSYIANTLGQYFEFHKFCPEVAIGMGIPRATIRLENIGGEKRAVGSKDHTIDVTDALANSADEQSHWHKKMCGYILKKDSPSCGMERVKLFTKHHPERVGVGIYAERLMNNFPELPVEEEGRLGDAGLRENFIQRVYAMYRWRQMNAQGLSLKALSDFHAQHKLIIMSHDQNSMRNLGRLIAATNKQNLNENSQLYIVSFMKTLRKLSTRGNHVNVLQHIQGYLKQQLSAEDKQELQEAYELYQCEHLPLIVPITLLRHHFRKHPIDYIESSHYMRPYPGELNLLNHI